MISNSQQKLIQSLEQKKYRKKFKLFLAEGVKIVNEILISELKIRSVFALSEWISMHSGKLFSKGISEIVECSENELKKISQFTTPNKVLALVEIPDYRLELNTDLIILLESIRDPGNLGTIIRLADWYGIKEIICSEDCVDVYNAKVIQASMGSILRVKVHYGDLSHMLKANPTYTSYGTFLEGENIHQVRFQKPSFLVIGNESNGISAPLEKLVSNRITIPRIGQAESLNASVACAIVTDRIMEQFK
ncbi:TrmH family RNA methyltransferase [Bacteroidota bacterium]